MELACENHFFVLLGGLVEKPDVMVKVETMGVSLVTAAQDFCTEIATVLDKVQTPKGAKLDCVAQAISNTHLDDVEKPFDQRKVVLQELKAGIDAVCIQSKGTIDPKDENVDKLRVFSHYLNRALSPGEGRP